MERPGAELQSCILVDLWLESASIHPSQVVQILNEKLKNQPGKYSVKKGSLVAPRRLV